MEPPRHLKKKLIDYIHVNSKKDGCKIKPTDLNHEYAGGGKPNAY